MPLISVALKASKNPTRRRRMDVLEEDPRKRSEIFKKEFLARNTSYQRRYDIQRKKKYPWKLCFTGMKKRCNNPTDQAYKWYGAKGVKVCITEDQVKYLWIRDKGHLLKIPSIDRIDVNKSYTLDNCRIIEKSENSSRAKRIPVIRIDGKIEKMYPSARLAALALGRKKDSHISSCIKGKLKQAYGFKWRYVHDSSHP